MLPIKKQRCSGCQPMGGKVARDQYVIEGRLEERGCVAVGGRNLGVSGVRVNPVNSVRENWGKGRSGEQAEL